MTATSTIADLPPTIAGKVHQYRPKPYPVTIGPVSIDAALRDELAGVLDYTGWYWAVELRGQVAASRRATERQKLLVQALSAETRARELVDILLERMEQLQIHEELLDPDDAFIDELARLTIPFCWEVRAETLRQAGRAPHRRRASARG